MGRPSPCVRARTLRLCLSKNEKSEPSNPSALLWRKEDDCLCLRWEGTQGGCIKRYGDPYAYSRYFFGFPFTALVSSFSFEEAALVSKVAIRDFVPRWFPDTAHGSIKASDSSLSTAFCDYSRRNRWHSISSKQGRSDPPEHTHRWGGLPGVVDFGLRRWVSGWRIVPPLVPHLCKKESQSPSIESWFMICFESSWTPPLFRSFLFSFPICKKCDHVCDPTRKSLYPLLLGKRRWYISPCERSRLTAFDEIPKEKGGESGA